MRRARFTLKTLSAKDSTDMRIANLDGRIVLLEDEGAVDVARASDGLFGPDPQTFYEAWPEFVLWASTADLGPASSYHRSQLGPPVTKPGQIFAVGLNYRGHA